MGYQGKLVNDVISGRIVIFTCSHFEIKRECNIPGRGSGKKSLSLTFLLKFNLDELQMGLFFLVVLF